MPSVVPHEIDRLELGEEDSCLGLADDGRRQGNQVGQRKLCCLQMVPAVRVGLMTTAPALIALVAPANDEPVLLCASQRGATKNHQARRACFQATSHFCSVP